MKIFKILFILLGLFVLSNCGPSKEEKEALEKRLQLQGKFQTRQIKIDWIYSLAVDPHNTEHVYAATSYGVYRSLDAGENWQEINKKFYNSNVYSLSIDPINKDVIYAAGDGGVYKSNNGGEDWIEKNNGLTNPLVKVITIDPERSNRLYAGCWGQGGLFISDNGGDEWRAVNVEKTPLSINQGTQTSNHNSSFLVTAIVITTAKTNGSISIKGLLPYATSNTTSMVYVSAFGKGIYRSIDDGINWEKVSGYSTSIRGISDHQHTSEGLTDLHIRALAIDVDKDSSLPILYAGTEKGVFKSQDQGQSWKILKRGMLNTNVWTLLIDPIDSETIYAGVWVGGIYKRVLEINPYEVKEKRLWENRIVGLVNTSVHCLAMDPSNPLIIYAGTEQGIFKSTNGAESWKAKDKGLIKTVRERVPVPPKKPYPKKPKPAPTGEGQGEGGEKKQEH